MKNNSTTIWFTSDLHFGHSKVIEFCKRPFKSVEEMDEKLIKNWNRVVKPTDTVIVLGDFFMYYKKEKLKQIVSRLNGTKVLVRGNHDMSSSEMKTIGFHHVCESMTMVISNELVNLSHFPYKYSKWKRRLYSFLNKIFPKKFYKPRYFKSQLEDDGRFLLHGHTHSKDITWNKNKRMIHIGTDATNYTPISLQKISNIIDSIKRG